MVCGRRILVTVGAIAAILAPRYGSAQADAGRDKAPFVSVWVALPSSAEPSESVLSKVPPSTNAPGLLVELAPGDERNPDTAGRLRRVLAAAHTKGWRAGLTVPLTRVAVPEDPRKAEATTSDVLYPGLGAILSAASTADLVVLEVRDLDDDPRARSYVLRRVASDVRSFSPKARVVLAFRAEGGATFPSRAGAIVSDLNAAFADMLGLFTDEVPSPAAFREAADKLVFGRPLFLRVATTSPDAALALAARFASAGTPAVAAPIAPTPENLAPLANLGALLTEEAGNDTRKAEATLTGKGPVDVYRFVSGLDLGGVVLLPAVDASLQPARGPLTLELDAPSYAAAEIVELSTGRRKSFDIPRTKEPPRLTLSTAGGPVAVRLTAREKPASEATKAAVGVAGTHLPTVEEILARHQAWRAARDARWTRFVARNKTSLRFRFADLNNTLDLTLAGPFFYEPGKGYDWAWSEAFFNGVRWRGKKIPELPLLQPEKVSELPLALTFNDAYRYVLRGEETVNGVKCYVLDFEPNATESDKPLYSGRVFVSSSDYSAIRTVTHQLNLQGEVQSVDETSDFTEVKAPDGGAPMRFPTHTAGQWIMRTFSRTTVLERETWLEEMRLDPQDFDAKKKEAFASKDVMVRDTDKGVRYLEKTKEGDRVVADTTKSSRLFGLAGVFYDTSFDYPLPLLGAYYLDLDFRKKHEQVQVFFGGVVLGASFNEPRLFGTKIDLGADIFGIAIRSTDSYYVNGTEDKSLGVKSRSFSGNVNFGAPVGSHLKLSATVGFTHRDFAEADETDPAFALPSNHWVTRLLGRAIYDISGWALTGQYAWNKRSDWAPWGLPGNPEYDPSKDEYRTYSVSLAKDFHLPKFRRIRTSVAYFGSSNTDRFSKYTFGFYGGTSLRGFRSNSLRAEQTVIAKAGYGIVVGDAFRIEGIYEHAFVKDPISGLDWASFGGVGLSGQLPGPWSTIVQVDGGVPVVGRNRGQTGFSINLVLLKIF